MTMTTDETNQDSTIADTVSGTNLDNVAPTGGEMPTAVANEPEMAAGDGETTAEAIGVDDSPLPYLTGDLPGVGGVLKTTPEDFVVEEIPLYPCSGEGEHAYLLIEKTDVAADALARHIAQSVGCPAGEIGVAGLKDKRAVTRQWISVPHRYSAAFTNIDTAQIRLLETQRHSNKLKTGHLAGNKFRIVLRGVCEGALAKAEAIGRVLQQEGFPNYYGEQRFGHDGETLALGLALLYGTKFPKDIPAPKRKFLLRLALSAVQSDLFNQFVEQRLNEDLFSTVIHGDVMEVTASGGKFIAEDPAVEQARCDSNETGITGPMFGVKMKPAFHLAGNREAALLQHSKLEPKHFNHYAQLLPGTRRRIAVRPVDLGFRDVADSQGAALEVTFTLPAGVYATTLLREVMKTVA